MILLVALAHACEGPGPAERLGLFGWTRDGRAVAYAAWGVLGERDRVVVRDVYTSEIVYDRPLKAPPRGDELDPEPTVPGQWVGENGVAHARVTERADALLAEDPSLGPWLDARGVVVAEPSAWTGPALRVAGHVLTVSIGPGEVAVHEGDRALWRAPLRTDESGPRLEFPAPTDRRPGDGKTRVNALHLAALPSPDGERVALVARVRYDDGCRAVDVDTLGIARLR